MGEMTMVERVRAKMLETLADDAGGYGYVSDDGNGYATLDGAFDLSKVARDVIAAMPQNEIRELIRTATMFVDELKELGYGSTSDIPLPGSYDTFAIALEKASAAIDAALKE